MPCDLQAQSRLADAAGADQGDQPMRGDQVRDVSELSLSADQVRHGLRKVRHPGGHSSNGRGRRRTDLARELIAASRHRPDQIAISAKHPSEHGDLGLKVVLLDNPVGPHAAHEFVLAEDRAASVEEGHQRIERPPAQLDRLAIGQQLAAMADDLEPAKFNGRRMFGQLSHGALSVQLGFRTFQNDSVCGKDS